MTYTLYLFEYKSHAYVSHTSIFDLIKRYKIFQTTFIHQNHVRKT